MPAPAVSTLTPGQKLDRYELLCPLAQGGMAEVWVARLQGRRGFERLVAVKTILARLSSDPDFQRMFLDEARLVASIRHPNVCEILDLGEEGDLLYFVLELVEGESLSALIKAVQRGNQLVPLGIALRIVADACAGLHAAHEVTGPDGRPLGVVHRDVSPANVLISTAGNVKLIDFGVAKAVNRTSDETTAGIVKGKVSYMSPEQALGQAIDRRSDVWALGVIMYQLLTGELPYRAENQLATLGLVARAEKKPRIPNVPDEVDALVRRAMARDPARRTKSAEAFGRELEAAIVSAGLHVTAADVAKFLRDHVGEKLERRKHAVARSLAAAEERARVTAELALAADDPSESGPLRARAIVEQSLEPRSDASVSNITVANGTALSRHPPDKRRSVWPIVGVVLGIAAGALVTFAFTRRSATADEPKPAAAVAPETTSASVVASAPPTPAPKESVEVAETAVEKPPTKPAKPGRPAAKPKSSAGFLEVFTERK